MRNNLDSLEEEVKKGVLDAEGIYGIEVINVNLQISDTVNVKKAKSDAESQKIKSESEKKANNLLKDSLDPFTPEQLDYMKTRMLSESGSIKWVISEGGSVIVNSGEPAGK